MAEEKVSATREGIEEDDDFDEAQEDNEEDCEATLDEEEALEQEVDYADELRELEDDNELSIEELRRKYGYPSDDPEILPQPSGEASSSSVPPKEFLTDEDAEDEEEEDLDYAPPEFWRKEVRVDPIQYQAEIPEFECEAVASDESKDTCKLWGGQVDEAAVRHFIRRVVDRKLESGQFIEPQKLNSEFDDEDALFAFLKCSFDADTAMTLFPFSPANAPLLTIPPGVERLSPEEVTAFEMGYLEHGKNFSVIQRTILPQRTVGELVNFYYNWKLKENYRDLRIQRRVVLEQRRAAAESAAAAMRAAELEGMQDGVGETPSEGTEAVENKQKAPAESAEGESVKGRQGLWWTTENHQGAAHI